MFSHSLCKCRFLICSIYLLPEENLGTFLTGCICWWWICEVFVWESLYFTLNFLLLVFFVFFNDFLWNTWHQVKHFKVKSSVAFNLFIIWCSHLLWQVPKYFFHLFTPLNPLCSFPCSSSCLVPSGYLNSICMDLSILDILYKWSHTVCDLFWVWLVLCLT